MALARGAGDFDLANRRRFQWPVVPGALIRDAPVLLLDEPTPGAREVILFEKSEMRKTESSPLRSGLDANTAASLAQALRRQSHKQSPFSASCTCTVVPYHGFAFVFYSPIRSDFAKAVLGRSARPTMLIATHSLALIRTVVHEESRHARGASGAATLWQLSPRDASCSEAEFRCRSDFPKLCAQVHTRRSWTMPPGTWHKSQGLSREDSRGNPIGFSGLT